MKKLITLLIVILWVSGMAGTQELNVSGLIKTGIYMSTETNGKDAAKEKLVYSKIYNSDTDSGYGEGLLRLDMHFTVQNFGIKVRFQQDTAFTNTSPRWAYAFAYGDLLNEQIRISAGLLGDSPWGTGGPELLADLETTDLLNIDREPQSNYIKNNRYEHLGFAPIMGMRFEFKPLIVPGLNIGFALNGNDRTIVQTGPRDKKIVDVLMETVFGIAYDNDFIALSAGYRMDSEYDGYSNVVSAGDKLNEGSRLAYKIEEKYLRTMIDGMSIALNGYYYGLGADEMMPQYFTNWFYWNWDAAHFLTFLNINFTMYKENKNPNHPPVRMEYQSLEFFPAYYHKLFNNLLQIGARFGFGMEFGDGKMYQDSSYQYYFFEPQVKLNIGNNASIALVYNYCDSFVNPGTPPNAFPNIQEAKSQKHWINLRAMYSF